jgi:hypothetical protein
MGSKKGSKRSFFAKRLIITQTPEYLSSRLQLLPATQRTQRVLSRRMADLRRDYIDSYPHR